MGDSIKVFAPATVANLTCGFDILGLALEQPGDELVARKVKTPGVTISKIEGDGGRLSKDPLKNTSGVSVLQFLQAIDFLFIKRCRLAVEWVPVLPVQLPVFLRSMSCWAGLWTSGSYCNLPWKESAWRVAAAMPTM
jgi:hypothetical protein